MSEPAIDARRHSTSSNNEYEQVFERYNYDDYKAEFQFILEAMKDITKRTTFNVPIINPDAAEVENQKESWNKMGDPPLPKGWMQIFGSTLNKISSELTSKTKTDEEGAKVTRILKALSNYSLKAKVVMVLAAFAVKYGKVCLSAGLYPVNPVARAVVSLRWQQSVLDRPKYLTEWHKRVAGIIKQMLAVSDRILNDSQSQIGGGKSGNDAVQLIIQCAIVCSSQMMAILTPDSHNLVPDKLPEPYKWNLCVLENALKTMLGENKGDPVAQDRDSSTNICLPEPHVQKETAAANKDKNQGKSKGRSSSRVKPANICC
nr:protein SIEVE ELEMENT OCCLUSION B [Ipomoea batatas]